MKLRYWLYRSTMRLAHRHNWHYAPPIYPEGNTQLWCKWCGFAQTVKFCETSGEPPSRAVAGKVIAPVPAVSPGRGR